MDSLVKGMLSGADDNEKRGQIQDFISRYEQGSPLEGISAEEAVTHYQAVANQLSPEELEESAAQAYERLSPDERQQFAQWLKERGGDQVGDLDISDPRQMAQATSHIQRNQPDGLAGLLGGGGLGDLLGVVLGSNSAGKDTGSLGGMLTGALGGGRGNAQNQGGGMSDILQNPIAKAVLGGIAAYAMKRIVDKR